ncbi:MAG: alpha/beta hydrolase [Rhodospirillaceae bacterium]|nr:alpha/beta hydrolase [Rhodospirillaceae bacterium]MBT5014405.1 alpha/beta hydrolase [Rhodospirillaceae bacterium]MBT6407620.1 alpha/beta hydrolase [Rhodospirillaceae bacterium]
MLTFALMFVFAYAVLVGVLYFLQRSLLYHPDTSQPDMKAAGVADMQAVQATTSDGLELLSWYRAADADMPTVVLFQGNAGNIELRGSKARPFMDAGYGMMLVGYRGFGGNPGSPSEQGLYEDARAALRYLGENGVSAERVVLYGESLGTGVAVRIAAEQAGENAPVAAVVLEAPFSSIVDAAAFYYPYVPVSMMLKDRFNSIDAIADIGAPVLFVHGEEDEVTPIRFGKRLFDAAEEPKQAFWVRDAGHNDLAEFGLHDRVTDFLNGLNPPKP